VLFDVRAHAHLTLVVDLVSVSPEWRRLEGSLKVVARGACGRSAEVLAVEPAHDAREILEESSRDRGHLSDDGREVALVDHQQIAVGLADHGRGARAVVDEAELADDGPGSEGGDLPTIAFHGDRAVDDDEGLPTGLALIDDHRPGCHADLRAGLGDESQFFLGAGPKEWYRGEVPEVFRRGGHGSRLTVTRSGVRLAIF